MPPRYASLFLLFSPVIVKENRAVARTLLTQVLLCDVAGTAGTRSGPRFGMTLERIVIRRQKLSHDCLSHCRNIRIEVNGFSGGWSPGEFSWGGSLPLLSADCPNWLRYSSNIPACFHLEILLQLCPKFHLEKFSLAFRAHFWCPLFREALPNQVSSLSPMPMH